MIVLTAPTGLIGNQVLTNVLAGNEPIRVIARDPNGLSDDVRKRVEVMQGSHGDREILEQTSDGAVFWLVPPDPQAESVDAAYVDFSRPACEAIISRGCSGS